MWGQSVVLLCFCLGLAELLTGAEAQEITGTPVARGRDLPPCESCGVRYNWETYTWDDYYTVAPDSLDAFSESIYSSHSSWIIAESEKDYGITIEYVTALPTTVITINDTYSSTLSCCDPYVLALVHFSYVLDSTGFDSIRTKPFRTEVSCSPTSTYFVPNSKVIFAPASGFGYDYRSLFIPSNTCSSDGVAGVEPPTTKRIVARLVEESESATVETVHSEDAELPVMATATMDAAPVQESQVEATSQPTPPGEESDDTASDSDGTMKESSGASDNTTREQIIEATDAPSATTTTSEPDNAPPSTAAFENHGNNQRSGLLTISSVLITFLLAVVLA